MQYGFKRSKDNQHQSQTLIQNQTIMKKIFFGLLALSAILFSSCNNSGSKKEQEMHDMNNMPKDSAEKHATAAAKEAKTIAITYSNMDAKAAASIKDIVSHYLHVKNALANDNGNEAADGAKAMGKAMAAMDKSLLTAAQKKVYDDIEEVLIEHAEHIEKNGDKIEHQRSHFSMMSEDVYDFVKAFGAGQPIYHDHCPMYNDNKGAMWLSEIQEVKNPYYGAKMLSCASVKEK